MGPFLTYPMGKLLWSVQNFELLISSDLYVLKSPEHVYEVFRMMSVCASVCPTFRSPTITQKRFHRLLSNLTNTHLPVVSRVEKFLVHSTFWGYFFSQKSGVAGLQEKHSWTIGNKCFFLLNSQRFVRFFALLATFYLCFIGLLQLLKIDNQKMSKTSFF
jgi:hypothetical protein